MTAFLLLTEKKRTKLNPESSNMKKKLISIFVALLLIMPCCGSNFPIVRLQTNFGDILIELNQDAAPVTVDNFLRYVGLDFYDGLIFHRITDIYDNLYVIQGGAFDIHFQSRDPCEPIISESNNGLSNIRGTIAMATMPGDPNSATSQFYINYEDNLRLDYRDANSIGYCVFGTVISDMNVIDSIAQVFTVDNVPTPQGNRKDVPVDPIIIYRAELLGDLDENDQVNLKDYSSLVNGWRINGNSDAAELAAADPTAGQWFGYSVAVSNNLAIIGGIPPRCLTQTVPAAPIYLNAMMESGQRRQNWSPVTAPPVTCSAMPLTSAVTIGPQSFQLRDTTNTPAVLIYSSATTETGPNWQNWLPPMPPPATGSATPFPQTETILL